MKSLAGCGMESHGFKKGKSIVKKRMFLIFMIFATMFLVTARVDNVPWNTFFSRGTTLLLPFPVMDAPVGIKSAEIKFPWTEYYSTAIAGYMEYLPSSRVFTADYTMYFAGDESAIVQIVHPIPNLVATFGTAIDKTVSIYVDGTPIETVEHVIHRNVPTIGSWALGGNRTPTFEELINNAQTHIASEPFVSTIFEGDVPMTLHTFTVDVPYGMGVESIRILFHYDPERTKLVYSTQSRQVSIVPRRNRELGTVTLRRNMGFSRGSIPTDMVENMYVFILGDDTLTWEYELSFFDETKRDDSIEVFRITNTSYVTPRNYFRQIQENSIDYRHDDLVIDQDLLMRWVNEELYWSLWRFSDLSRFTVPDSPSFIVAEIPFEPGQERVLNISFLVHAHTMWWYFETPSNFFHYTVLAEAAEYWAFFESLTITVEHPENIINHSFLDDFETFADFSMITLQNPSDIIHFVYWLPGNRTNTGKTLLAALFIIALNALFYWKLISNIYA